MCIIHPKRHIIVHLNIFSVSDVSSAMQSRNSKGFMSWGEGVDSRQINEEKDHVEDRKDEKGRQHSDNLIFP